MRYEKKTEVRAEYSERGWMIEIGGERRTFDIDVDLVPREAFRGPGRFVVTVTYEPDGEESKP